MTGALEDQLRQVADEGYDGIEHASLPPVEPAEWADLLERHGLGATLLLACDDFQSSRATIEAAATYKPDLIMSHTGLDRYDFERGKQEFTQFLQLESDIGVRIAHETHRHRMFFNPFATRAYLEEFPEINVLADFSHWCVVCESNLPELQEYLDPAIAASIHIHARVGYRHGPQVPDPSAPEYAEYLKSHVDCWDAIKAAREADGTETLIVTPEFGPPFYMHTLPHTNQPVIDLSKVCMWMRDYLKAHWG